MNYRRAKNYTIVMTLRFRTIHARSTCDQIKIAVIKIIISGKRGQNPRTYRNTKWRRWNYGKNKTSSELPSPLPLLVRWVAQTTVCKQTHSDSNVSFFCVCEVVVHRTTFFPVCSTVWNLSSSVTLLPPTIHSVPMLSRRRLCLGTRNDEPFINIKSSVCVVERQQPEMSATIRMLGCIIAKWPWTTTMASATASRRETKMNFVHAKNQRQGRKMEETTSKRNIHNKKIFPRLMRRHCVLGELLLIIRCRQRSHRPALVEQADDTRLDSTCAKRMEKSNERNGKKVVK